MEPGISSTCTINMNPSFFHERYIQRKIEPKELPSSLTDSQFCYVVIAYTCTQQLEISVTALVVMEGKSNKIFSLSVSLYKFKFLSEIILRYVCTLKQKERGKEIIKRILTLVYFASVNYCHLRQFQFLH